MHTGMHIVMIYNYTYGQEGCIAVLGAGFSAQDSSRSKRLKTAVPRKSKKQEVKSKIFEWKILILLQILLVFYFWWWHSTGQKLQNGWWKASKFHLLQMDGEKMWKISLAQAVRPHAAPPRLPRWARSRTKDLRPCPRSPSPSSTSEPRPCGRTSCEVELLLVTNDSPDGELDETGIMKLDYTIIPMIIPVNLISGTMRTY